MTTSNPLSQSMIDFGVVFKPAVVAPGKLYWRLVTAQGPMDIGGNHHLYVDTLDESGQRVVGVPVIFYSRDEEWRKLTEAKPGEEQATNLDLYAGGNSYGVRIGDGLPSDDLFGVGLGSFVPHHAFRAIFQRTQAEGVVAPPPSSTVPRLAHPLRDPSAAVISQAFGPSHIDYSHFGLAGHSGLDFAVPAGTSVVACDDGVVQESGMDTSGYGEYIKLRHAWGESLYAHLSHRAYEAGIHVAQDAEIGRSGNSGNSTGPHLHFAIRINPYTRGDDYDGYSDPLPFLEDAGSPLPPSLPPIPQPTEPTDLYLPSVKANQLRDAIDQAQRLLALAKGML